MATIVAKADVSGAAWRTPLFVATILTGSFLLFLVQPMIARMALPRLGGAPAVWNSAMLVYQTLLLAGYAYAHAIGRLPARRQALIHLAVFAIAALWLPIGLAPSNPPPDANPVVWVPWLLALSIGPLFFAVAAQAPLMQHWYGMAGGEREPYALYAASNLGSFGGLIAYPLLVEPQMALNAQSGLWTAGYVLLFALVAGCALTLPRGAPANTAVETDASAPPTRRDWLLWIALAAVPSGLMLSTTTHLTTDIVAMPLLWVLPLGLYLLSFSIAFAGNRMAADGITRVAPLVLLLLAGFTVKGGGENLLFSAGAVLLMMFTVAVALHTRMYRLRPAPRHLTRFYLAMSIGGALGGVFAALLAPTLFDWTYEHPILIVAAAALLPQAVFADRVTKAFAESQWVRIGMLAVLVLLIAAYAGLFPLAPAQRMLVASTGLVALGVLAIGRRPMFVAAVLGIVLVNGVLTQIALSADGNARVRSYFGVYTILDDEDAKLRRISHGTTVHGLQSLEPGRERAPTSYYVPNSGVGQGLEALRRVKPEGARVGIVGLGAGTLACYARPGEDWRFYEIDPAVVKIARDPARFSFLSRCTPGAPVEVGDARLTLAAAHNGSLDFLALDAFSSDAVPMHLLTREAFAGYRRVLGEDGLLLVHISNRHLDLEPVLAAIAAADRWYGAALLYEPRRDPERLPHSAESLWIAMTPSAKTFAALASDRGAGWRRLRGREGFTPWSDDYSTILPLVKGWRPPSGIGG